MALFGIRMIRVSSSDAFMLAIKKASNEKLQVIGERLVIAIQDKLNAFRSTQREPFDRWKEEQQLQLIASSLSFKNGSLHITPDALPNDALDTNRLVGLYEFGETLDMILTDKVRQHIVMTCDTFGFNYPGYLRTERNGAISHTFPEIAMIRTAIKEFGLAKQWDIEKLSEYHRTRGALTQIRFIGGI